MGILIVLALVVGGFVGLIWVFGRVVDQFVVDTGPASHEIEARANSAQRLRPPSPAELPFLTLIVLLVLIFCLVVGAESLPNRGAASDQWLSVWLLVVLAFPLWAGAVVYTIVKPTTKRATASVWSVVLGPLLALLLVGISYSGVAFEARWTVSQGAFDRAARRILAGEDEAGWIGLYRVRWVASSDGSVWLTTAVSSDVEVGIAYVPDGLDSGGARADVVEYSAIGDGWYVFVVDFCCTEPF